MRTVRGCGTYSLVGGAMRVCVDELRVRGQTVDDLCVELGVDPSCLDRALKGANDCLWIVRELRDRAVIVDEEQDRP